MKVFYRHEQTAESNQSFSPSAGKPAQVVASWQRKFGKAVEVVNFEPLTRDDIALAHDRKYVDAVLDLRTSNGFGNKSADVAATLPYTCGSFYAAARHAAVMRENAESPTSGFHHAGYADGGGFCTFNGLMVAAQKLYRAGFTKVGILDLDMHYGNGTEQIIWKLGLDYITHYTFGGSGVNQASAAEWLKCLPEILADFAGCDVVLYQAGADPHVDDPMGGVLTTVQMYLRDVAVFTAFRGNGVPVAWNLAGGYQKPLRRVLDLHDNTFRACLSVQ